MIPIEPLGAGRFRHASDPDRAYRSAHRGAGHRRSGGGRAHRGPQLATRRPSPDRARLGPACLTVRTGAPGDRPGSDARCPGAGRRPGTGGVRGAGRWARGAHHRTDRHPAAYDLPAGQGARRKGRPGHSGAGRRRSGERALPLFPGLSALGAAARGRLSESAVAVATGDAAPGAVPAASGLRDPGAGGAGTRRPANDRRGISRRRPHRARGVAGPGGS